MADRKRAYYPSDRDSKRPRRDSPDRNYNRFKRRRSPTPEKPLETETKPTIEKRGLRGQIHPSLLKLKETEMADIGKLKPVIPKFATVKANIRVQEDALMKEQKKQERMEKKMEQEKKSVFPDTSKNPYLESMGNVEGNVRRVKRLNFVTPGKYVAMAEQMREEAFVEKLKQDIAEAAKKAGLEKDLDLVSDAGIRTVPPPPVEWWDVQLLPNGEYSDLNTDMTFPEDENPITDLIHHPFKIQPPNKDIPPPPLPIMLTKKERKKLRRHLRAEAQKDKQDKIRMGLLPPEQPKLKISNLMRVLGSEAVQDPTQIEAQVRAQVQARQEAAKAHDLAMKLTPEEKAAKLRRKYEEKMPDGVHVAVFKLAKLAHPQHRYKVDINAKQFQLTGVGVIYSDLNIVVVEGGSKSIKDYKKLMLRRIKWERERFVGLDGKVSQEEEEDDDDEPKSNELKSTELCALVWEGKVQKNQFPNFRYQICPTEQAVKEYFEKMGAIHYWNAAKNFVLETSL